VTHRATNRRRFLAVLGVLEIPGRPCTCSNRTVAYAWVADQWPAFPDYDAIEDALRNR
jgi:hypothetical protein